MPSEDYLDTGFNLKEFESGRRTNVSANFRIGVKVPLNVYEGDRPLFQAHTPEEALQLVGLLNDATRLHAEVAALMKENQQFNDLNIQQAHDLADVLAEVESLRKQIAEQPSRPDSLKPMDAWLDMDSFSEPWACDLVCYAQKLERHVAYLRGLLERARDHMNGDGFAFDLKQEIDRAMEKAE